jgi:hypothetical protein
VFALIDHSSEKGKYPAADVPDQGFDLRQSQSGNVLMIASQGIAMDLPLRILVSTVSAAVMNFR